MLLIVEECVGVGSRLCLPYAIISCFGVSCGVFVLVFFVPEGTKYALTLMTLFCDEDLSELIDVL